MYSNTGNNPSLLQGQEFKYYEQDYINNAKSHLDALQTSSIQGVGSIIEAMNSNDSVTRQSNNSMKPLSQLESEFNKTLSEYTSAQKNFSEESKFDLCLLALRQKNMVFLLFA